MQNLSVKVLQAFPLRKIREQFPEIQVPQVFRILGRIIASNTPRNAVLSHIEIGSVHDLIWVMCALRIRGQSLCAILDNYSKLLSRDLATLQLVISTDSEENFDSHNP